MFGNLGVGVFLNNVVPGVPVLAPAQVVVS